MGKFVEVAAVKEGGRSKEFFGFQADARFGKAVNHLMKKYGLKKGEVLRVILENDPDIKQALKELADGEEQAIND